MKSFAAALLLAAVNGSAMTAINTDKSTWATGYDVYLTSAGTDIVMETQFPAAADNWVGIDFGSKKFDGNGFTQSFDKANTKATIGSATFTTLKGTALSGGDAEWKQNAKTCLEASNLCDSKRALTKAGTKAVTITEGTAALISWAYNASNKDIAQAAVLQKAGTVTFTSGKTAVVTWDNSVATAVTAATALVASQLF